MPGSHHPVRADLSSIRDSHHTRAVVTDLTVSFCTLLETTPDRTPDLSISKWRRVDKDLLLHSASQCAWLLVAETREGELQAEDLVVTDVRVGEADLHNHKNGSALSGDDLRLSSRTTAPFWESRPGGIQVARTRYSDISHQIQPQTILPVTGVDVLFGVDAVDPRPHWTLLQQPLQLPSDGPDVPVPRITIRHSPPATGPVVPAPPPRQTLRAREDGTFKIVQISDTHMVTGVGVCNDAIDAHGQPLPSQPADPLTIDFLGHVLDLEGPDLVVLTGDQLHHDITDSQSALFKVVTPLIDRRIPYAAVFGNHDSEGVYALTRESQMSLLQDLPFSLCQPGPDDVEGVGNYYLSVFGGVGSEASGSEAALATLYFVDSHGQIASDIKDPDYDPIKQSQIDWFTRTSQLLRKTGEGYKQEGGGRHGDGRPHLSLAFLHIPFPEYEDDNLVMVGGRRREPTEGPSFNSHFYDALFEEGVLAVGCGHDHVNDFCGLLPRRDASNREGGREYSESNGEQISGAQLGPWLCYGGGSGFGGYCSYGETRYHRRTRVWELDTETGGIKTWKRVEYSLDRVDELVLVEAGAVVDPRESADVQKGRGMAPQAEL